MGAMTNTVNRLTEKRYLAVPPDPDDGRGKLAELTPAGRAARNRAVNRLGQGLAPLAGTLSDPELRDALLTLHKARVWFDRNRCWPRNPNWSRRCCRWCIVWSRGTCWAGPVSSPKKATAVRSR
ncbi:MAG: hypothetical protein ING40_03835 [Burkholderiales bacterium]|nr:hypothetical protein [Burkholderiales bacterium]MCA3228154.1 hypothetical protein [Burkholderiales bacterium]